MQRAEFLNGVSAIVATVPLLAQGTLPANVAGIDLPDSPLAREATQMAQSAEPAAIFNHSVRTFLFAELIGKAKALDHDVEAVYVASLLHDIGLAGQYSSANERFEVDGANASRSLLKKYRVEGSRADDVWDAIALHDCGGLARWKQPVVRLVNAGVAADFGAHLDQLGQPDVIAVLQAAPRRGFVAAFLEAAAAVAKQKPAAAANFVVDVGNRMVPGFHQDNFCDSVHDNPFAGYGPAGAA